MRRLALVITLVIFLAIIGGVVFGLVRAKQKREAEITEFSLCETLFKEGQYQEATQSLEEFLHDHPKSEEAVDAYYYLAMSCEKLQDRPRAMEAWSKIIERYPTSRNIAEAYYYSGFGYQNQDQYDKAMENYKNVVNRFSNMPIAAGAWHGIGMIYEKKQQDLDAVRAYQNVLEKHPDSEFAADAERRWGNIRLEQFLKEKATTYAVKRGDSLVKIAARLRITPELIMRLNGLKSSMLQSSQILKIVNPDFNILVDLSSRRLSLRSGDTVIKKYTVGIGKDETPTPIGDFRVTDKLIDPVWYSTTQYGAKEAIPPGDPRNELGPRWIGFKPAYGIHGTIDPDSIGKAMSNGCVRMHNQDVEELYDLVGAGTPVRIVAELD